MKKVLKIILTILLLLFTLFAIVITLFINKGYFMYKNALDETPIETMASSIKSKENYTLLEDIPQIYKDAVIAVEDHRFYEHLGIDYIAILSAIVNDISAGKIWAGGSTITQQLCKNVYFTQERKLERKFAEIFMAAEAERVLQKDEILELYINTCFYGNGCYTLKEASNKYYNKEPNALSDYEATLIAGIPNAPSLYNPIHSEKLAKERQRQVLYAMVKYGYITKEERDLILKNN